MKYLSLLLCFVLLFISSCSQQIPDKVTIAINPWPGYEFLYLAEQKGFFKQVGANITLAQTSSLSDGQMAYLNGHVQGFASTLIEAVQVEAFHGEPINVVLLSNYSNGGDVIITKESITSMNELKGKKVGCEVSSLGIYILERALTKYGLSLSDVILVNTEQTQGQQKLINGDIDAFVTYSPYATSILRDKQYHSVFTTKEIPNEILDVISISKKVLKQQPSLVKKLHQAWDLAIQYHQKNVDEANAIMAKREQITVDEFKGVLNDLTLLNSQQYIEMMQEQKQFNTLAKSVCLTLNQVGSFKSECVHSENLLYRL
jgi:NitT/TauT family transport system substrate-binding protein